jgi:hypothetical protein
MDKVEADTKLIELEGLVAYLDQSASAGDVDYCTLSYITSEQSAADKRLQEVGGIDARLNLYARRLRSAVMRDYEGMAP